MTTCETYLAAKERLRDDDYRDQRGVMVDKATIYDALHDATPATVEWLEGVGFLKDDDLGELRMDNFSIDYVTRNRHLPIYFENRRLIESPTRGQVLMLLSVSGEGK